jgi:hypothetical protein
VCLAAPSIERSSFTNLNQFQLIRRQLQRSSLVGAKPLPPNLNQNRIRQIRRQLIDKMANTDEQIAAALEPLRIAVKEQGEY